MTAQPWVLGIDFGTTSCLAAVRVGGGTPEVLEIGGDRRVPSVVLVTDGGELVAGRVAEDLSLGAPDRAVRAPKGHVGEPRPLSVGGRSLEVADIVAALLRPLAEAAGEAMGSAPAEVRLTHPATWSGPRREHLRRAASAAGLGPVVLVPEPVAAAVAYADATAVPDGGVVAVYDLGGGTFDTTILRAVGPGRFEIIGRPTGDGQIGGELFDEILGDALIRRLDPETVAGLESDDPAWVEAAGRLRLEVRRAKEALSSYPYTDVTVASPTGFVRLRVERSLLESLLAPYVAESVEILARTVADAGLAPGDLTAIHLAGGASRIPLVGSMLTEAFPGVAVSRRGDPKTTVAVGATLVVPAAAAVTAGGVGGAGTVVESRPVTVGTVVESRRAGTAVPVRAPEAGGPDGGRAPARSRRWIAAAVATAVAVAAAVTIAVGGGGPAHRSAPPVTTAGGVEVGSTVPLPASTAVPVTAAPTTAAPTTLPPTARATQAQLDAAALDASDLGPVVPTGNVTSCGNYTRPALYARVAYEIQPSGSTVGVLINLVGAYPSVAAVRRVLRQIPPTVSGCTPEDAPFTVTRIAGQQLCDQSYEGYGDGSGEWADVYLGMVRCGTTLDVVEVWFVDHRGATGRQLFATALQDAAARLAAALG